jgi:multicomponent K+:H+ antiporter subunit G
VATLSIEDDLVIEFLVSCFLIVGGAFTLVGSIGLARFPDFYTRLHGPSKASTLGVGAILIASLLHFNALGEFGLKELLITFFIFLTAPVSAHLLCKAAFKLKLESTTPLPAPGAKKS